MFLFHAIFVSTLVTSLWLVIHAVRLCLTGDGVSNSVGLCLTGGGASNTVFLAREKEQVISYMLHEILSGENPQSEQLTISLSVPL